MLDWTVEKESSVESLPQVPTVGAAPVSAERTTQSGSYIQRGRDRVFPVKKTVQGILVGCEEMVCCQR